MKKGFTLIELLIVVAIIAILAAIAVPNFLEAQTRAKVSRTKADMRSVATALESFYVDNNWYPPDGQWQEPAHSGYATVASITNKVGSAPPPFPTAEPPLPGEANYWWLAHVKFLSTPISYMSSMPLDVFAEPDNFYGGNVVYQNIRDLFGITKDKFNYATEIGDWLGFWDAWGVAETQYDPVRDVFPIDGKTSPMWRLMSIGPDKDKNAGLNDCVAYDPTNGTISYGNINRAGP